jgi:hypothetical protein
LFETPFGRGSLFLALLAATFPAQIFLYNHKKICVMPENRVLLAWIGYNLRP